MIKVICIRGTRNHDNPEPNPFGHFVTLTFQNDHGTHTLELNGERPLPEDPALRNDLEWLLWDYGLLSQQEALTGRQRVRAAQQRFDSDRLNYKLARAYMEELGSEPGEQATSDHRV